MATAYSGTLPPKVKNLAGKRSGKLTIIRYLGSIKAEFSDNVRHSWECVCDCGNIIKANSNHLTTQGLKSCGCIKYSVPKGYASRPRLKDHPLYGTWTAMKSRCFNEKNKDYRLYGGRGITVEEPWRSSFSDFYEDMIGSWSDGLSIDRIDSNGNYCKSNCRFADDFAQANNTRRNVFLEFKGKRMSIAQWSREIGISRHRIMLRASKGLPLENVLECESPNSTCTKS